MENTVRKNLNKTKIECYEFLSKLKTEIPLPILQGSLPVIIFSRKESDVDAILGGLLAGDQLIKYSFYLLIPYAIVLLVKWGIRLSFDSSREKFEYLHLLISEVGTGFLTISRTGLGATIGCLYLVHTTQIITASPREILGAYIGVISLLHVNCMVVFLKDRAMKSINHKSPPNPYRLDKNLR
ncbi:hypothetical protein K3F43_07925 [Pseudomonas tussilaginis]|uniref:hypothetical protein n=1 Tax=unclassified Pseudomonas TaxID=196821 RepID=UPI000C6E3C3D|nr:MULTISPECIES: hypothetical protein [unclassified Pseudomonas]QYX49419.1 hypothetical protein K3F43_07925 [Pseudomonas sp. S11A 273]